MECEDFIYTNKNSLSEKICNEIIDKFNNEEKNKYKGITNNGLNLDIKDTYDFIIPNFNNNEWSEIRKKLENELEINTKKYVKKLSKNINENYKIINNLYVTNETFQIQKYEKNIGKFTYHHDFSIDYLEKKYRVIVFIFYLNDVKNGGETEIWGKYKIKPETGKLLLFPACWTFPHSGLIPKSDDKYIITGWMYAN